jgi:hypothetical protein
MGHPKKQDSTSTTTGTSAATGTSDATATSETSATSSTTSGTTGASGTTGTYTATGTTSGTSEFSGTDAPADDTSSAAPDAAPPPSDEGAEVADSGAAAPPAAAYASNAAAPSPTAEDAADGTQAPRLGAVPETAENRVPNLPMTPRLRELIAQLKSPLPIPTGLRRFTTDFHPDLDMLTVSRPLPQAQQVKRDMIAAAATTLVAQANFDRHDVLALLGLHGDGAATLN